MMGVIAHPRALFTSGRCSASPRRWRALPSEPRWLSIGDIIEFNRLIVAGTGEPFHLRDRGLLESAWARPMHVWSMLGDTAMPVLACQLLLGIARNHPFVQGNKRTALTAADGFLHINGYDLAADDEGPLADLIIAALGGDESAPNRLGLYFTSRTVRRW